MLVLGLESSCDETACALIEADPVHMRQLFQNLISNAIKYNRRGGTVHIACVERGAQVAIEKTYHFANYYETISFVNAVAFVANAQDHHPDLSVHFNRCVVRLNTHDVQGISATDFDCASRFDALLA